jgi:hypothetical protein
MTEEARAFSGLGFDSEPNHVFAREEHGVRTIIPPRRGRPSDKPARGRYRRLMETRFDRSTYAQRAQVETVISMIKRRQGAHVCGLTYWSQCRDLRLKALTHNVMILLTIRLFYRAGQNCSVEASARLRIMRLRVSTRRMISRD